MDNQNVTSQSKATIKGKTSEAGGLQRLFEVTLSLVFARLLYHFTWSKDTIAITMKIHSSVSLLPSTSRQRPPNKSRRRGDVTTSHDRPRQISHSATAIFTIRQNTRSHIVFFYYYYSFFVGTHTINIVSFRCSSSFRETSFCFI